MKKVQWTKPSTREFIREGRAAHDYSFLDLLHGYFYGRWPYLYIGVGTGQHRLVKMIRPIIEVFQRLRYGRALPAGRKSNNQTAYEERTQVQFADGYHGKVMPLQSIKQLVMVKEPISLPVPETILPYARARDLILKEPDHILALDCPCRAARENPCLPLDVCLIVGEPFVSFVAEHHPDRSRAITSDEAIEILQAEDKRGHVHHAFFKEAMLGRFYAICNCCSCCCGAMQAHRNGTPMLAASGYLAEIDPARCTNCGVCAKNCQFGAITANGVTRVDPLECMGCGICVSKCARGAIHLIPSENGHIPLELDQLMEAAAHSK